MPVACGGGATLGEEFEYGWLYRLRTSVGENEVIEFQVASYVEYQVTLQYPGVSNRANGTWSLPKHVFKAFQTCLVRQLSQKNNRIEGNSQLVCRGFAETLL